MSNRKSLLHLRALPPTMLALAASGVAGSAMAQAGNPTTGMTLYSQQVPIPNSAALSCNNCHGAANIFKASRFPNTTEAGLLVLINGAIASNKGLMGAFAGWTPQMRADVAAYLAGATAAPPPPPLVLPPGTPAPAPAPTPAPAPAPSGPTNAPTAKAPAAIASTEVGKESATIAIPVTNTTTTPVNFATPALISPNGANAEFVATTAPSGATNCVPGYRLDVGATCSFGVRFAPRSAGTRTETWKVAFANGVASQDVVLTGTAVAPATSTAAGSTAAQPAASSTSGGGGALGWLTLAGLGALGAIGRRRPR